MEDFKKYLNQIQIDILEVVASGIEKGILKEEELPIIAEFVLNKIDNIKNHYELDPFLTELSSRWPIFSNINKIQEGEVREMEDKEEAQGVLTLLKHGKIDQALSLAKHATKR